MSDNVTPISEALRGATAAPDFTGDGDEPFQLLPPGCPITMLGQEKLTLWLIDCNHQLLNVKPRELGKGELTLICGDDMWMIEHYPQWSKGSRDEPPKVIGFNQAQVQSALVKSAAMLGVFSPIGKVFGRGAHRRLLDDALVLHLGTKVLLVGAADAKGRKEMRIAERKPGVIEDKIYPGLPKLSPPAHDPSSPQEAQRLLGLFGKWYFFEPDIAPLLLLGWVGQALICGAFNWRAHVWLTGETAAGKSTLQKVIRATLGDWGMFTGDATEAAVRHVLGDDTLPVLIDEAEGDDKPEKQKNMINLARKSSSGEKMHRGSSDQTKGGQEFTVYSAFLFSSILHAPLDPQDRNRFAILAMRRIPDTADEPQLDLRYWNEAGRRMQRRMLDQWPRFDKTLHAYKSEIAKLGFQGRWRDTFGMLLACADMLLHDEAPQDAPAHEGGSFGRHVTWTKKAAPLMERGQQEAEDTTTRCLIFLTSSLLPAMSGHHQESVGGWIRKAVTPDKDGNFDHAARAKLLSHGIGLANLRRTGGGQWGATKSISFAEQIYVMIASKTNAPMRKLFADSQKWFDGGWTQALRHAEWKGEDGKGEPISAVNGVKFRFGGNPETATAVPIEALIGPIEWRV